MAIFVGVGASKNTNDSYQGGFEACKSALEKMGGGKPDFTFTFASAVFDHKELMRGIHDASEGAPGIGCSSAGEIMNSDKSEKSVVIMTIKTDQIIFFSGMGNDVNISAREAGHAVAKEIKEKAIDPVKLYIMLSDILAGSGEDIVAGALDVLGEHFPVVGGAAGDGFMFEKTYQYRDNEVASNAAVGVGLSGTFTYGIGVRHGWMPIGAPMKVTKSKSTELYELDHKPAIYIYEDYFGISAETLAKSPLARLALTYPLGMKIPEMDEYLIRDPLRVDAQGVITCTANIPEGAEIRLMIGSKEKAIEAASYASRDAMKEFENKKSKPKFVILFDCAARQKLFGQRAVDELDAIMDIIGLDVPIIGLYAYGEQAPIGGQLLDIKKTSSRFFNEAVVVLAIGE
ncbi:MAG: FIST N-terminal domain-containing protein [Candidatus Sungbacteria bacterium]|nr:FIST N-terminal domain-containing protein [bacterium]MDZ4260397.1 FIST N-terminal domain-containing protein [Candidatus Sungbacteria bacterium]